MRETFGSRLASALTAANLTPTALAGRVGSTQASISNWINDKVQVEHAKAGLLLRICDELHVSPYWLLFGEGDRDRAGSGVVASSQPVKLETLKLALEMVDETLKQPGLTLPPSKKAEVASLVYELLEEGMPQAKVLRFARAAAA